MHAVVCEIVCIPSGCTCTVDICVCIVIVLLPRAVVCATALGSTKPIHPKTYPKCVLWTPYQNLYGPLCMQRYSNTKWYSLLIAKNMQQYIYTASE